MQDGQVVSLTGGDHNHPNHLDKIEKFIRKLKDKKPKIESMEREDLNST